MKIFLQRTTQKFFGAQLEFRVRLFNILAAAGTLISLIAGVTGIFVGAGPANFILNMLIMILSAALLRYSFSSGKYQLCYMISVICIFLMFFPALFFSAGGYHSGMPLFFVFAVLFTVFMLEGKKRIITAAIELSVYTSLCIIAYYHPETINFYISEADIMIDIIICFNIVSIALGVTMALHLKIYSQRQKELEAARRQVEEYAMMKSKLFAGMSHEMRTPLTVMSAYAQFAVEQIKQSSLNEKLPGAQTAADLATISDEAKRLAQMADETLKILMSTFGAVDGGIHKNLPVNMGDLCSRLAHLFEPVSSRRGKKLQVFIGGSIPEISGDADALTQLVWNILHNAITHSDAKTIKIKVETCADDPSCVKIVIIDDGTGIDPKILPHIFERGVSGKEGSSGLGLTICRDIARRHGGGISVESPAPCKTNDQADRAAVTAGAAETLNATNAGTIVTVLLRGAV